MKQLWKRRIAYVLLIVFTISCFPASVAFATYSLEPITLKVKLAENDASFFDDLNNAGATVNYYQIAAMQKDGSYTIGKAYEKTSVKDIIEKAEKQQTVTAKELLNATDEIKALLGSEKPIATSKLSKNGNTASTEAKLVPGLYLIYVEDLKTNYNEYHFVPGMAFVPSAKEVEIKVEKKDLTAELTITKTLSTDDNLTGEPLFVFDILAVDPTGKVVFSDVAGIRFTVSGTQSVTIKGIPAGSKVTVKEVYSNASYHIESEDTITIDKLTPNEANEAEFVNDYNHGLVYGTGVINHYAVHEADAANGDTIYSWQWSQE